MRRAGAGAIAATILALTACGSQESGPAVVTTAADNGWNGASLDQPYDVAPDVLTDTDSQPYSLTEDTDAPVTLVFFGYTNCPDICQLVMSNLAAAKLRLPEDQRKDVDVVLVTTDPARDDEKTLRAYLDRFDPTFIGLTGPLTTINQVGTSVAVYIEKGTKLPSGGYEVAHNDHVVAVTANDQVPVLWTRDTSAAQIAEDLEKLLEQES